MYPRAVGLCPRPLEHLGGVVDVALVEDGDPALDVHEAGQLGDAVLDLGPHLVDLHQGQVGATKVGIDGGKT